MKRLMLTVVMMMTAASAWAAGGSSSVGPANPASVLCVEMGGDLEMVEGPGGTSGFCTLEEWHLYGELDERGRLPELNFGGNGPLAGMANPASVTCVKIGGKLTIRTTPGGETGYCTIEEWALYHWVNDQSGIY